MSQERMGGSSIVSFEDYLKRKALRDAEPKTTAQQEMVPPLTSKQALVEARMVAAKFPGFKALAQDIDRQQNELGQIPGADNLERARADFRGEFNLASRLSEGELDAAVKTMFAGYDPKQTVFLNSKYLAYARVYLERVDKGHKLPDMEL